MNAKPLLSVMDPIKAPVKFGPGALKTGLDLARACGLDEIDAVWHPYLQAELSQLPLLSRDDHRLVRPSGRLEYADAGLALHRLGLRGVSPVEQLAWYCSHPQARHLQPNLALALCVETPSGPTFPCVAAHRDDDVGETVVLGCRLVADGLNQEDWILAVPLNGQY